MKRGRKEEPKKKKEEEKEEEEEEENEEDVEEAPKKKRLVKRARSARPGAKAEEKKEPTATKKKEEAKSQPKKKAKIEDDEEEDGEEKGQEAEEHADEEEHSEQSDSEYDDEIREARKEHLAESQKNLKKAIDNFTKETKAFEWESPTTHKKYILRAFQWPDRKTYRGPIEVPDDKGYDWPRAFVGLESQPVQAAIWLAKGSAGVSSSRLVAVHTFSPTGDETSVYVMKDIHEELCELLQALDDDLEEVLGEPAERYEESFSVSSGDYATRNLYCPALKSFVV